MIIRIKQHNREWHRYFVWFPMVIDEHFVWLHFIERKYLIKNINGEDVFSYRKIETENQ